MALLLRRVLRRYRVESFDPGRLLESSSDSDISNNIDIENEKLDNIAQFERQCCNADLRTFSSKSLADLITIIQKVEISQTKINTAICAAILLRFQMNAFYLNNDLFTPLAAAVFNRTSLLNHSCVPNVIMTYDPRKRTQQVRVVAGIAAGEELVHSYVDLIRCRRERATILQKDYAFSCSCSPQCVGLHPLRIATAKIFASLAEVVVDAATLELARREWAGKEEIEPDSLLCSDASGLFVVGSDLDGFEDVGKSCINSSLNDKLEQVCNSIDSSVGIKAKFHAHLEGLKNLSDKFSLLNRSIYSMRCEAYSLALDLGLDEMALILCHPIILVHDVIYRDIKHHPLKALQLHAYADLLMAKGFTKQAKNIYTNLVKTLQVIYGKKHQFTIMAENQLNSV